MIFENIKKANILTLFMFLTGCYSMGLINPEGSAIDQGVNPKLEKYVEEFKAITYPYYSDNSSKELKMGFGKLDTPIVGMCYPLTMAGGIKIVLDKEYWTFSEDLQREALALHELGHCLCGLEHEYLEGSYDLDKPKPKNEDLLKSGFLSDGCPVTLMYPEIPPTKCLTLHMEEYKYEIRSRCMLRLKLDH